MGKFRQFWCALADYTFWPIVRGTLWYFMLLAIVAAIIWIARRIYSLFS